MPDPIEDPRQDTTSELLGWETDRWQKDPTVWQHPHEKTPDGDSLVQTYEVAHPDGEVTVIDLILSLDQYQNASQDFEDHLIAMVQSRAMQLAPDRVEPVSVTDTSRIASIINCRVRSSRAGSAGAAEEIARRRSLGACRTRAMEKMRENRCVSHEQ